MATLLTATPAMMIRDYVVRVTTALGVNPLDGWEVKIGALPDSPDQVISFNDTGGDAGFPNLLVDYPTIAVQVRGQVGSGYQSAYTTLRTIRDIILGMDGHPPEFSELDGVTERGHIVSLGYDERNRQIWTCNFRLLVEPEANALSSRASL